MWRCSAKIEAETNKLPLPKMDRNPHFRYLDEMEEKPRHVVHQTNLDPSGGHNDATRYVLESQMGPSRSGANMYMDLMRTPVETMVPDQVDRDSRGMRWIKNITMAVSAIAGLGTVYQLLLIPQRRTGEWWMWLAVCVGVGVVRGILEFATWRRDRKFWS